MKYGTIFSVHLTPRGPKLGVLGPKLGQIWVRFGSRGGQILDTSYGLSLGIRVQNGSQNGPIRGPKGVQNGSILGSQTPDLSV